MGNRFMNGLEVSILSYIVDDDPDTALIVEQLLASNGIKNFHVYTKAEELLSNINSDIIVCVIDYYLSAGLTGIDVLKQVKNKNKGSFVIIISGSQDYKTVMESLNAGADRYIDKNNKNYLTKLVEFMQEGLTEAKKRWGLMNFLEAQIEKRKVNDYRPNI